jgi:hypothetical protein
MSTWHLCHICILEVEAQNYGRVTAQVPQIRRAIEFTDDHYLEWYSRQTKAVCCSVGQQRR